MSRRVSLPLAPSWPAHAEIWYPSERDHASGVRPMEGIAMQVKGSTQEDRIKIAAPLFNERVAPYFGASSKISQILEVRI